MKRVLIMVLTAFATLYGTSSHAAGWSLTAQVDFVGGVASHWGVATMSGFSGVYDQAMIGMDYKLGPNGMSHCYQDYYQNYPWESSDGPRQFFPNDEGGAVAGWGGACNAPYGGGLHCTQITLWAHIDGGGYQGWVTLSTKVDSVVEGQSW